MGKILAAKEKGNVATTSFVAMSHKLTALLVVLACALESNFASNKR